MADSRKRQSIEDQLYEETVKQWEREMEEHDNFSGSKAASARSRRKKKKKKKTAGDVIRGIITAIFILGVVLFGIREYVSYTKNPFIVKWRTIYIETAMTTHSHKWLATWTLPRSLINQCLLEKDQMDLAQKNMESYWKDEDTFNQNENLTGEEWFYATFWELDNNAFRSYLAEHPEKLENGYENLLIEDLDGKLGLCTVKGDNLLVVDAKNHIAILGVTGDGYVGKLALVKQPKQIKHVLSKTYGSFGEEIGEYANAYDAVLAINASAFKDTGGHGGGATARGSAIIDGKEYGAPNDNKFYAMDMLDHFYVTNYNKKDVSKYRWGVQFFPALIVNDEVVVDGPSGYGIQPRTAIGQANDGTFMMLIIDGRQRGYSLGATVDECARILSRYNATQAGCLDGGSSSIMIYKGKQITKCSSKTGRGRYCPDALIVIKADEVNGWVDTKSKFPK